MTSPAQRHMMRVSAAMTAQREAAPLRHATVYEQMLVKLAADQRTLKAIYSKELKAAKKRELLPFWLPWVNGVLEQGKGAQDDILMTVMLWRLDTGDIVGALEIARYALKPAGDEPVIKNTFFFPDIDPKRVRERMRLEQTVAPARLREAIKSGMAETNAELYEYREQKIAAGFTRLADVPADDIDGESIKVFYYERAVCAMATASLYERYRGVDASAKGDKKADSIDSTIDELWRDMRWAVARIQDKPRCIVSQI